MIRMSAAFFCSANCDALENNSREDVSRKWNVVTSNSFTFEMDLRGDLAKIWLDVLIRLSFCTLSKSVSGGGKRTIFKKV